MHLGVVQWFPPTAHTRRRVNRNNTLSRPSYRCEVVMTLRKTQVGDTSDTVSTTNRHNVEEFEIVGLVYTYQDTCDVGQDG